MDAGGQFTPDDQHLLTSLTEPGFIQTSVSYELIGLLEKKKISAWISRPECPAVLRLSWENLFSFCQCFNATWVLFSYFAKHSGEAVKEECRFKNRHHVAFQSSVSHEGIFFLKCSTHASPQHHFSQLLACSFKASHWSGGFPCFNN